MSKLTTFLMVLILVLAPATKPIAQEPAAQKKECGTIVTQSQIKAELDRADTFRKLQLTPQVTRPYHLPLTIHIVKQSDGTGGFTLSQVSIAMKDLNRNWESVGVQFFQNGSVDYINSDHHFNVPDDQARRDELRQVNPVTNTINVYFTNLAGLCGQSSFTTTAVQGVLMDNGCAGVASNPSSLAHEIGHYFDLYHTHETAFNVECPSGGNCSTAGDLLCDTPADPDLSGRVDNACVYNNSAPTPNGCGMTAYAPSIRNLMSYSVKICRNQFTPNQSNKMLLALQSFRSSLISSGVKYVASDAWIGNSACTYQAPCKSVSQAINVATPGHHIFILSGSYPSALNTNKAVILGKWDLGAAPAVIGQ